MQRARMFLGLTLGLIIAACSNSDEPPPPSPATPTGALPEMEDLPAKPELPDLFQSFDGTKRATTAEDFRGWRSTELRGLFEHYLYGRMPAALPVTTEREAEASDLFGGKATYEEIAVRFDNAVIHVALFAPKNSTTKLPVIIAPSKCGNQSLVADPRIRATTSFSVGACTIGGAGLSGADAAHWQVEQIIDRGFALATYHESDAAPDDTAHIDEGIRVHIRVEGDERTRWGVIGTWAYASQRVIDALEQHPAIDPKRIAVFGHSRRGKAALWTAATDPRVALVMAHQSGTAGAALTRSKVGESLSAITTLFPHWFNRVLPTFANEEDRMPIDQHQLLALIAPRAVLLTDGAEDEWADPPGAQQAAEAARPAWKLFDAPATHLEWKTRPGKHAVEATDWTLFLDFAARHLEAKPAME